MIWIEVAAGLLLLFGGGEALVKGSVGIARRLGVSPLLIGLTLVGFGTSMPELVASLEAAMLGAPSIAVGNVVGSNIANILLILGISAIILPVATPKQAFRRDGVVLIGSTLLLLAALLSGIVTRWIGLAFLALLGGYTILTYRAERRMHDGAAAVHAAAAAEVLPRQMPRAAALALTLGGIAAIVFGANLLVRGAIEIARDLGLSEAVIGLTLVAIGTSLPELATSVMAALRRHGDVAFGNIVGSSIFNALGIVGATAAVAPIAVPDEIVRLDVWVMLATTLLLVAFAVTGWRISRREGLVFLAGYAAYMVVLLSPGLRQALALE